MTAPSWCGEASWPRLASCLLLMAPVVAVAMAAFILIGLGAANVVPVLFRRAGSQKVMPSGLAIAAITTMGYAEIFLGPAVIGFVAKHVGLTMAFWMIPRSVHSRAAVRGGRGAAP